MKHVIAGNWKMHRGPAAAAEFFRGLALPGAGAPDVIVFPCCAHLRSVFTEIPVCWLVRRKSPSFAARQSSASSRSSSE
jgi:triosephosphate isomerase